MPIRQKLSSRYVVLFLLLIGLSYSQFIGFNFGYDWLYQGEIIQPLEKDRFSFRVDAIYFDSKLMFDEESRRYNDYEYLTEIVFPIQVYYAFHKNLSVGLLSRLQNQKYVRDESYMESPYIEKTPFSLSDIWLKLSYLSGTSPLLGLRLGVKFPTGKDIWDNVSKFTEITSDGQVDLDIAGLLGIFSEDAELTGSAGYRIRFPKEVTVYYFDSLFNLIPQKVSWKPGNVFSLYTKAGVQLSRNIWGFFHIYWYASSEFTEDGEPIEYMYTSQNKVSIGPVLELRLSGYVYSLSALFDIEGKTEWSGVAFVLGVRR